MVVTDIALIVVIGAILLGLGTGIAARWGFYREILKSEDPTKIDVLDGLRCYLALGVFFHHGILFYFERETGQWEPKLTGLFGPLGPMAVNLFFMITGFLFWGKAIRGSAALPMRPFLIGRILRIGPMYLFVSALVYGTILVETGFRLDGPIRDLAAGVTALLTLGLFEWQPLNGVSPQPLNAFVNWTLQFEWAFYLTLPVLAVLATPRRFVGLCVVLLAIVLIYGRFSFLVPVLCFLAGMATAHSIQLFGRIPLLSSKLAGVACLALLVALPAAAVFGHKLPAVIAMAPVFFCVAHGNPLFGLLELRGARMLGTASYSIYLMHGYFLYLGRWTIDRLIGPSASTPLTLWFYMAACGIVTILVSSLTYRYIEHPCIALSHRWRKNAKTPKVPS